MKYTQEPADLSEKEISAQEIVVGTRGSALAMWQTEAVIAMLQRQHPAARFVVQTIKTQGDKTQALAIPMSQLGDKAMFVAELEQALLAKRLHIAVEPLHDRLLVEQERLAQREQSSQTRQAIDAAVHSLKDLPGELPAGLTIAAITERADARDVLVSRQGWTLERLPKGARVATSSLRRRAQLLHLRPDLEIVEIRGNIDTRLRKALAPDGPEAVVLAAAGLERLGLTEHITEYLSLEVMLPAAGQGALAVEVRADDAALVKLVAAAEHTPTRRAVQAERALLTELGGGCQVPIGVYASVEAAASPTAFRRDELFLQAVVASPDGKRLLRRAGHGTLDAPEVVGQAVARELLAAGADEILAQGRAAQPGSGTAHQE
ncbi:MAG TPA: hydroxymethylbilane synthase [Ktedonobacterales bacterium]|jgi:hydroxymethylbilane synthase